MSAAAIGGATPFAWAQLGMGALGIGAQAARPAGPSSADALFGPSLLNHDSSGWLVNLGGGSADLNNSQRGAPNQTPVNTTAPGGYAAPIAAPGNTAAALGGALAGLPWLLIIGGALVGVVLWKKA